MIITVDPADQDPPYLQIRIQVLAAIASGALPPGTRLPTIRQLAIDLDLAPGTVARAYRELEVDGAIATRGRKGSFVREQPAHLDTPAAAAGRGRERERELAEMARTWVEQARQLDTSPGEVAAALARALGSSGRC